MITAEYLDSINHLIVIGIALLPFPTLLIVGLLDYFGVITTN